MVSSGRSINPGTNAIVQVRNDDSLIKVIYLY